MDELSSTSTLDAVPSEEVPLTQEAPSVQEAAPPQAVTPVAALRQVIAERGRIICDNPAALREILIEDCPQQPDQIALLMRAQEARVPADLLWHEVAPRTDLANRLADRLETQYSFSEEDALWAVSSWIEALDIPLAAPQRQTAFHAQDETFPLFSESAPFADASVPAAPLLPGRSAPPTQSSKPTKPLPARRSFSLPGWAIGAVAVLFILVLGAMIYTQTGPPPNPTIAPGVIYKLPPGYKAPTRADHLRARMMRHVKTTP